MSRRRGTNEPEIRTEFDVDVGMTSVQVGVVNNGLAQTNSGPVVVQDPNRPAPAARKPRDRDPRR